MNVANGKCLQTQLYNAPQPYSEGDVMYFLVQICAGLWHMHKQGFIHRDLKPANIFCDRAGSAWVADLGFSIRAEKARDILGTPSYMAPEIWLGHEYSHNVDVWALGISLYQLLTKQLPFSGHTIKLLAQNIIDERFVFPQDLITKYKISPQVSGLVSWMLTKDCAQRPSLDRIIATPFMQKAFAQLAKILKEKPGFEEHTRNLISCAYNAAITTGVDGYNVYIAAAGSTNQGAEATRAYNAAIAAGVADVCTHNAYITAAGQTNQGAEAMRAYNAAIAAGVANVSTYNAFITAAGKTNQGAEAKRAYNAAIAAGVADVNTHNAYIIAADNTEQREEAIHAFNTTIISRVINEKTCEAYAQVISRQTGQNPLFFQRPPLQSTPSVCHQLNGLSI